ncbi:hypothetical protein V2J09_023363 [Rumex salicifolius]
MAFSVILRRSISTAAPLAARVVGGQRFRHASAISSHFRRAAVSHGTNAWLAPSTGFTSRRNYSASSDAKLLEVIESEIECAVESTENEEGAAAPEDFPFKIEDNLGENIVTLERQYEGDTITVEVHMPNLVTGEDDNDNDDGQDSSESHVPLVVKVAKKNGAVLEFTCTGFPDEITIDALSMKNPDVSEEDIAYEGPDFSDLDENLQKAFHKYLEIRGIKPSTTNFLHEYMIAKDNKEYVNWLNGLKSFVKS